MEDEKETEESITKLTSEMLFAVLSENARRQPNEGIEHLLKICEAGGLSDAVSLFWRTTNGQMTEAQTLGYALMWCYVGYVCRGSVDQAEAFKAIVTK